MILQYKHFTAQYHWAAIPGLYVAELNDIPDVVSFCAATIDELKSLMIDVIESYLTQKMIKSNI